MKLKKIIVLVGMFFGCMSVSNAFSDLPENHWAYDKVVLMTEQGIINGYDDGSFKPEKEVSREEFATILTKALNLTDSNRSIEFEDIADDRWSKKYIDAASPYLTGYLVNGKYYFKPAQPAVREDMAVAVVKAKGLDKETPDYSVLNRFSDEDKISSSVRKYIAIAVEHGIMQGNSNGTFNPLGNLTRAEITALISNVLESDKVVVDDEIPTFELNEERRRIDLGSKYEDYMVSYIEADGHQTMWYIPANRYLVEEPDDGNREKGWQDDDKEVKIRTSNGIQTIVLCEMPVFKLKAGTDEIVLGENWSKYEVKYSDNVSDFNKNTGWKSLSTKQSDWYRGASPIFTVYNNIGTLHTKQVFTEENNYPAYFAIRDKENVKNKQVIQVREIAEIEEIKDKTGNCIGVKVGNDFENYKYDITYPREQKDYHFEDKEMYSSTLTVPYEAIIRIYRKGQNGRMDSKVTEIQCVAKDEVISIPNFEVDLIAGVIDLGNNHSKYKYSFSMNKEPKIWYSGANNRFIWNENIAGTFAKYVIIAEEKNLDNRQVLSVGTYIPESIYSKVVYDDVDKTITINDDYTKYEYYLIDTDEMIYWYDFRRETMEFDAGDKVVVRKKATETKFPSISKKIEFSGKLEEEIDDEEILASVERVIDEGIMNLLEDGTFRPYETMTRAQMAQIVCKMLGVTDEEVEEYQNKKSWFLDVNPGSWYTGYINILDEREMLIGMPKFGTFRPDDEVTMNEVLTFMINSLGRGKYVESMGTWPGNYVAEAAKLGLMDGTKGNEPNRGNIAVIICNTLDAPAWEESVIPVFELDLERRRIDLGSKYKDYMVSYIEADGHQTMWYIPASRYLVEEPDDGNREKGWQDDDKAIKIKAIGRIQEISLVKDTHKHEYIVKYIYGVNLHIEETYCKVCNKVVNYEEVNHNFENRKCKCGAEDISGTEYEEAIYRLHKLGIMQWGHPSISVYDKLTKAEMATLVCNMLDISYEEAEKYQNKESYFFDVKPGEWYTGYINILDEREMLIGFPESDNFRPDDEVTMNEVLTFMINSLGRGEYVSSMGSWPGNYVTEAAKLGLTKGIVGSEANRGNIAIIVCNTLDAPAWEDTSSNVILYGDVNGDGAVNAKDRTILARYLEGWDEYEEQVNMKNADIFTDGKVDKMDNIVISRYIAGWDVAIPHKCGSYTISYEKADQEMHKVVYECKCKAIKDESEEVHNYSNGKCKCGVIENALDTTSPIITGTPANRSTLAVGEKVVITVEDNESLVTSVESSINGNVKELVVNKNKYTLTFGPFNTSGTYKLVVTAKNEGGCKVSKYFTYYVEEAEEDKDSSAPTVTSNPTSGTTLMVGERVRIIVEDKECKIKNVAYSWNGASEKKLTPNVNKYNMALETFKNAGTYKLVLVAENEYGLKTTKNFVFYVKDSSSTVTPSPTPTTRPTPMPTSSSIVKSTPNITASIANGSTLEVGTKVRVTVKDSENKIVKIVYDLDGDTRTFNTSVNQYTISTSALNSVGKHTIKVTAENECGVMVTKSFVYYIEDEEANLGNENVLDTTPPTITPDHENGSTLAIGERVKVVIQDSDCKLSKIVYYWNDGSKKTLTHNVNKLNMSLETFKTAGTYKLEVMAENEAGLKVTKVFTFYVE